MPGLNSSTAKALIGRFLLPSERKALSAFASIQEEFASPFSRKRLSEAIGKPLNTEDDVLETALDSYLGNNTATLERLPPEVRKIAESVGTRSKKATELMEKTFKERDFATTIGALGLGAGVLGAGADEAEASTLDKALAALAQKFGTKKVTPEFLRNFLTQKMGVTSKELETRGIDAWLSGRKEVTLGEALETLKKQKPLISEVWVEEPVYAPWTLPGTKNYRELLIRAEQVEGVNSTSKLARVETLEDKLLDAHNPKGFFTELPHRYWSRMDALETIRKKLRPFSYESPHWRYPNVLAHIRFSDREFPKHGRTLMVEEFQSDWSKDWRAQEVGRATGNARIPKHPLIENWQSLVANRALKEAVDGNYKALAWAGSETHEARYALGDREWTKALYDKAMVNRFNKIGKKYGVQVTSDVIERVRPIASEEDIRVLEQYRDEFQKALKAFEGEIYPTNTIFHLLEETADYLVNKGLLSELEVQTLEGPGFELVQNLLEGNSPIKDYFKGQVDKFKVFILPITSEMRKAISKEPFDAFVKYAIGGATLGGMLAPDEAEAGPLNKALAALAQKSSHKQVTPEYLRNFLTQKMGVSSKEIEVLGLEEWLASRKTTTIGEVFEASKKLKPPISEVWMSKPLYSSWTLPGGENYRELLIQANQVGGVYSTPKLARIDKLVYSIYAQLHKNPPEERTKTLKNRLENLLKLRAHLKWVKYVSPHWDQPNVLAHIRFTDRNLPQHGKTLLVEEFQSDWNRELRTPKLREQTPDHPLVDEWQGITARRALKEAVDGNYNAIAWPSSRVHETRYSLEEKDWTKALYDEAMVKRFNKIGKKYGVQVEESTMRVSRPLATEEDIRFIEQRAEEFRKLEEAQGPSFTSSDRALEKIYELSKELVQRGLIPPGDLERPGVEIATRLMWGYTSPAKVFPGGVETFKLYVLPINNAMRKSISKEPFDAFIKYALGGVTLGGLLTGEDAEAGFLPKKLTQAAAKKLGNLSSASIKLKGAELMGKTIKDVRLGNEPWRYITFEDGTYLPIHKKYIASLVSSEGEKTYTSMYDLLPKGQQKLMLERSHALRMADILSPKELAKGLDARASHLKELGEEAPERVMTKFRGKQTLLPTLYAEGVKKHGEPRLDSLPQIFRKIEAVERPAPPVSPPSRGVKKTSPVSKPQLSMKDRSIRNLERTLKAKGRLPPGDEYILRRLKGASPEEAEKGLKLVSTTSVERMVKRILEESR